MEASITIITTFAEDPDSFEEMSLAERRERSGGWKAFPLRSGRYLDTFLMAATSADFGVFASAERPKDAEGVKVETCLITRASVETMIPELEAMIAKPDETARALVVRGGGTADVGRVREALTTGNWPESGDPAEEAAAFTFQLLKYARYAKKDLRGVCLEYRGKVIV